MRKEVIVLDYVLDVTPDANRYQNIVHLVKIDDICIDCAIRDLFVDTEKISIRKLFNNLDGDDRSGIAYTESNIAGSILSLASFHRIHRELDEDGKFAGITYEDIDELIEEEFNVTFSCSVDNMCSYLFGRMVLNEQFKREEVEVYEQMYEICENLLWTMVVTLADEVDDISHIAEIMLSDKNTYPVAVWEEDFILTSFLSIESAISHEAFFTILNRGMTSAERYDRSHRCRS